MTHATDTIAPPVIRHTLTPLERSERRLGWLMMLPAFLLLGAVVLFPIFVLIKQSFHFLHYAQPWRGTPFVGFEHYARALGDDRFWEATWHTALYVVITVPGAVAMGLGLALLANKPFRVKWPVRLGLLLPWALPLVFSGLIFRWFFEYREGIVNNALNDARSCVLRHLPRNHLEVVEFCSTRPVGRPADNTEIAL
jgi:ABC-type sugar transport system permease subunit